MAYRTEPDQKLHHAESHQALHCIHQNKEFSAEIIKYNMLQIIPKMANEPVQKI